MDIKKLAEDNLQYMVDIRRDLHMYPEPSFEEFRTTDKIAEELDKLGLTYTRFDPTGLMCDIVGDTPGKMVALRADIDALSLTEANDIPYKSKNEGMMHACGHDTHAAMLLGAAKILSENKDQIKGTVRLIFQPAEEIGAGARKIIEQGCLDGVDNIMGLHIGGGDTGNAMTGAGPIQAAAAMFRIKITGKGGHGASPHTTVDSVVVAAQIVLSLQTLASREIDPMEPVVVTVGKIESGSRFNVIANEALLEGTVRTMSRDVNKYVPEAMGRIVKGVADAYRATAELEYVPLVEVNVNEEASAARLAKAMEKVAGKPAGVRKPGMGSEDFSEYTARIPGAFGSITAGSPYSNHHPKFDVDESTFALGAAIHVQYALDFLSENK